jgi:apolipoprotein N-acyltransferase
MTFRRQLLLVTISALLLPLAFPPFGAWPLILLSMILLMKAVESAPPKRAFLLGLFQGAVGYGLTVHWLARLFGPSCLSLFTLLGLFTAVFAWLFRVHPAGRHPAWRRVLFIAVLWTAIEFYRSELFFLHFPWATPGVALGPTLLSPWVGVYGASFFMAAAAAACLRRETLSFGLFLALVLLALGGYRGEPVDPDVSRRFRVALVQSEGRSVSDLIAMTRAAGRHAPDLVIWPEGAVPYAVRDHEESMERLRALCRDLDCVLILGTKTSAGPGAGNWYNTALTMTARGVRGEYYKVRPVPLLRDGLPGRSIRPVHTPLGTLGTPICYDCDSHSVARRLAARGAGMLAVPSYDARHWGVIQHLQHAMLFRLRAAENARWTAVAASSGVSQVIDPRGHVRAELGPMKEGVIAHPVSRSEQITFYTRAGWLFPWICLGSSLLWIAAGCRTRGWGRGMQKGASWVKDAFDRTGRTPTITFQRRAVAATANRPEIPMGGQRAEEVCLRESPHINASPDTAASLLLKGLLIGVANIIPGVSGGTFALILGIFDRMINALNRIGVSTVKAAACLFLRGFNRSSRQAFAAEWARADLGFLAVIGAGAVASIVALSSLLQWLLEARPGLTLSFFLGLILPSLAVPWGMMSRRGWRELLWVIPGAALTVGVALAFSRGGSGSTEINVLTLSAALASGALAISAMALPGISGSFVLLIIGQYTVVLHHLISARAMHAGSVLWLAAFAAGCGVGLVSFARLLHWILARWRSATLAFLIGLVLGSFWILWPFKEFDSGFRQTGRSGEVERDIQVATAPQRLPHGWGEAGLNALALAAGLGGALGVEALGRKGRAAPPRDV